MITQNVDNLHQRAGSRDVIEFHGNIFDDRCFADGSLQRGDHAIGCAGLPGLWRATCDPALSGLASQYPRHALNRSLAAASDCDVFLSIGTSSLVYPAAGLADLAKQNGATVAEINPEPDDERGEFRFRDCW